MSMTRLAAATAPLLLTVSTLLAGCGDDGGDADLADADAGAEPDAGPPAFEGHWTITQGNPIPEAPTFVAPGLIFDGDGTGSVLGEGDGGFVECVPVFAARTGDVIAVDFGASGVPLGRIYTIVSLTDDELTMFDEAGRFLFLTRRAPGDEFDCDPLEPIVRFGDLPKPMVGYATDLEFNGTDLFYANDALTEVERIDAATGALVAAMDFFPSTVVAEQAGDLWFSPNAGNNADVTRRTLAGGSPDTVDLGTLGQGMNIQAMAIDPADNNLLLFGLRSPDNTPFLVEVNAANEPDVIVASTQLEQGPSQIQSMAHDGTNLWTIASAVHGVLLRLDPTTFAVTGSFQLPENKTRWSAVAAAGGRMFVLGVDEDDAGVIIEVTPPDA